MSRAVEGHGLVRYTLLPSTTGLSIRGYAELQRWKPTRSAASVGHTFRRFRGTPHGIYIGPELPVPLQSYDNNPVRVAFGQPGEAETL